MFAGAAVLTVSLHEVWVSWYVVERGSLSVQWSPPPLGLCDVAYSRGRRPAQWGRWMPLVELTYLWGLGGTVEALLTPKLFDHFPSLPIWTCPLPASTSIAVG